MNTADTIRKVTMTLLINSSKDVDWVKTPNSLSILFSQCKVSLCERNTHDVSSLLVNVGESCCSISAQKTTRKVFFTICSQSENTARTWKCTRFTICKWTTQSYASDLPFKNFCKLTKRAETIRHYQKQVLVMIKDCLANSQINWIPE